MHMIALIWKPVYETWIFHLKFHPFHCLLSKSELKSPQKKKKGIFWFDYCSEFGVVIGYITQDKRDTRQDFTHVSVLGTALLLQAALGN